MEFSHIPVMAGECVTGLDIRRNKVYMDGTCGGGNHSLLIAERLGNTGRLICVDQDEDAISATAEKLKAYANITLVRGNFANTGAILDKLSINRLDGVLLDLGVSSFQLDEPSRGFSFLREGLLDMRMNRDAGITAREAVNELDEAALKRVFIEYGEERFAGRIARDICKKRADKPIDTTLQLADIVSCAIPRGLWEKNKHPSTRVFQALRIYINGELEILDKALRGITERLETGGRLCVITFHSLEDRIVKTVFKNMADPCCCPKTLPYCVCGKKPQVRLITGKPITPSEEELERNVRSRSAKLRIAQKI